MLTNKSFIKWANENVVILVAHNELGHEPIEDENVTGEDTQRCPLYPGLTCREHLDIAVETDNSRDDELPVVPFIELAPNSWLVQPDGKIVPIKEEAQFTSKGIKDATKTMQKELGDGLGVKEGTALIPLAKAALEALDEETWRTALDRLATLRTRIKKPGKGFLGWLALRMETVEEEVAYLFEEALEDEDLSDDDRRQLIAPLFQSVDVKVGDAYVPVRDRMAKWLKAHPATSGR
ncbi:MAG: hypothetical protein QNJ98_00645 [Planctomycetota bacterium]|nr:hypothetical protein [Planctomycetota bacterium]